MTPSIRTKRGLVSRFLDLQDILIKPVQRCVKRVVEREIFEFVLLKLGRTPERANACLNWGTLETPELVQAELIHVAELNLIRTEDWEEECRELELGTVRRKTGT